MNKRWLILGLVLSIALHGTLLWPAFTERDASEHLQAARPVPKTVEVVPVTLPESETEFAHEPESELQADSEPESVPETSPVEEPSAPAVLVEAPSATKAPASSAVPATIDTEQEIPVEHVAAIAAATETARAATAPTESTPSEAVAAAASEADPVPSENVATRSRAAALLGSASKPLAMTPAEPRTRSRVAAAESQMDSVSPPAPSSHRPALDPVEIRRRIESARERVASTPSPVLSDHDGEHLSRQNGPAKVVPQLEWRSLDRWRAVASKSGLRLMALSSDGGPTAFVEESRGRWRRVPMEGLLSGYSARVRIVDHVSAFQAVRSCLRVDERLAILVPQSVEMMMEDSMREALRRRSMEPSEVAICSGILQPDERGRVSFRVDRITRRRSS